jgi:hypothetical protein
MAAPEPFAQMSDFPLAPRAPSIHGTWLTRRASIEVAELRRTVAAQRDEIARLKGGPGRPNIKPSGMEKATESKASPAGRKPGQRGRKTSKLTIHEERTIELMAPPQGSRFKGYTDYVVEDLLIRPHVVNFRRERWQTADGATMTAPLPAGISGHFGPELRRFGLAQYHQAQVTVARLLTLLRAFGIIISKRQIVRLLIAGQDGFLDEARDVLRAGVSSAKWITVDDTRARHKAANGFCTQIGNAYFAWFGTTDSKSRSNFLELLRAGHDDYAINAEAAAYMRQRALSGSVIARWAEHPERVFADQTAWTAHLDRLGILALKVNPDRGADRASNDADVSSIPPIIPYGGFSPIRLVGWHVGRHLPANHQLKPAPGIHRLI